MDWIGAGQSPGPEGEAGVVDLEEHDEADRQEGAEPMGGGGRPSNTRACQSDGAKKSRLLTQSLLPSGGEAQTGDSQSLGSSSSLFHLRAWPTHNTQHATRNAQRLRKHPNCTNTSLASRGARA